MEPWMVVTGVVVVLLGVAAYFVSRAYNPPLTPELMQEIERALLGLQQTAAANVSPPAPDDGAIRNVDFNAMAKQCCTVQGLIRFVYTVAEEPEGIVHTISSQLTANLASTFHIECMAFVLLLLEMEFQEAGVKPEDAKLGMQQSEFGTQYIFLMLSPEHHARIVQAGVARLAA